MTRRRSGAATRDEIRVAAARLFRESGFAGTSVREIAASARSDPALVIRHFGSKELLFLDTMRPPLDESMFDAPLKSLGTVLVESYGRPWRPEQIYLGDGRRSPEVEQCRETLSSVPIGRWSTTSVTGSAGSARCRSATWTVAAAAARIR